MEKSSEFDLGPQPLGGLLKRLGLSNSDLVSASTEQLTHKMVAKGCKGRRLTMHARHKILNALQILKPEQSFSLRDLFNYQ